MASFVGTRVTEIGEGCGCTQLQILSAINANIVEIGATYTGGGPSGDTVLMEDGTDILMEDGTPVLME